MVWRIDPDNEIAERVPNLHNLLNADRTFTRVSGGPAWHQQGTSGSVRFVEDRYESNNSRSSATSLPSNTWLSNINGRGVQYNDDYFRITVGSGQTLVRADLRFIHAHGDIDLQLQDGQGSIVAASRSTDDNEFLEAIVPAAGTYYLRVFYGRKGNTYDLRWDSLVAPDLRALEMSAPTSVREAGQQVSVSFKVQNTGGAAGAFRVKVYLSRDNVIEPDKDLEIGRLSMSGVSASTTSALQTIQARLPAAGSSFWDGDGEYFVGIVVDADQIIVESDEFNNFGRGIGIDTAAIQVVVHPYGTFTTTTVHINEITVPQFDAARGTLQRVEVTVLLSQGVTKATVMPSSFGPIPRPDVHAVRLTFGPFQLDTYTLPIPLVGGQVHTEILQPMSVAKTFTGSQLAAFLAGEQRWQLPSNSKTSAGFGGHTHGIDTAAMVVTTKFIFDPPDADLLSTSFSLVDVSGRLSAKDRSRFEVEYTVINQGPGPSPRFRVGFFISPDSTITTSDVRLATETFEHGMSAGGSETRRQSLVLPHAASNFWNGDGLYYVGMILDIDNEVDETSKLNNSNLGLAVDLAQLDVVVKPPGTHVEIRVDANGVTFPAFDASLGVLNRVEAQSTLIQGVTDAGGQFYSNIPSWHHHTFDFELGPMQIVVLALPQLSGFPHPVVPMQPARVEFTAGQLNAFSSDQSWSMSPLPVSTTAWNHSHQLLQAVFHTEVWYYFDVLPNLLGASFSNIEPLIPGTTSTIEFQIENTGKANAGSFEVEFFLRGTGYDETELILGRSMVSGVAAETTSETLEFQVQLPFPEDPFWAASGDYTIGMRIDPDRQLTELDSEDNENRGDTIDSQTFSILLREDILPTDLGVVTFSRHNLDVGENWLRVEAARSGPMTLIANSDDTFSPVRLTIYRAAELDQDATGDAVTEEAIRPFEVARTFSHQGRARLDVRVEKNDAFYVRVSGAEAGSELIVANVIKMGDGQAHVVGTPATDVLRVSNGANPTMSVNDVTYHVAALDANVLYLDGVGEGDQFFIEPLAGVEIQVTSQGSLLEVDVLHYKAALSAHTIEVEGRGTIRFSEGSAIRLVNNLSWNNIATKLDVNNDRRISTLDALLVINALNLGGPTLLPDLDETRFAPDIYLDTNDDGRVSAIDALLVINALNARSNSVGGEGEMEDTNFQLAMTELPPTSRRLTEVTMRAVELVESFAKVSHARIPPTVSDSNYRYHDEALLDDRIDISPDEDDLERLLQRLTNPEPHRLPTAGV